MYRTVFYRIFLYFGYHFPQQVFDLFSPRSYNISGVVWTVVRESNFAYYVLNFESFENFFVKIYSKISFAKPAKDKESNKRTMGMFFS